MAVYMLSQETYISLLRLIHFFFFFKEKFYVHVFKCKISPRDRSHLCTFIILICHPFSKSFNSSIFKLPLIYGTNMALDVLTQLRLSYLLRHKNTNLRGQPQFTAWQVEARWKIVS